MSAETVLQVTIRLPAPLRGVAGGQSELPAAGRRVRDVLADAGRRHPELLSRVLDDAGAVRRFVNVYLGQRDIRALSGLDTEVAAGDVLTIIPAVAGGR
jgi:sulfur-carrier protein